VLNSLTSASGQRTYEHAIREFVAWYCSEPRLAFNRTWLDSYVALAIDARARRRQCTQSRGGVRAPLGGVSSANVSSASQPTSRASSSAHFLRRSALRRYLT
jgi:hypothetical protein